MFVSRPFTGAPKSAFSHWNLLKIRSTRKGPIGKAIPRGAVTGLYSAKWRERTAPRLAYTNRIIEQRNYNSRNEWKKEDAHFEKYRQVQSRRRRLFPIAEKDVQRYEFFPTAFCYPVHPEPFDHKMSSNKLFLGYKRDPTGGS